MWGEVERQACQIFTLAKASQNRIGFTTLCTMSAQLVHEIGKTHENYQTSFQVFYAKYKILEGLCKILHCVNIPNRYIDCKLVGTTLGMGCEQNLRELSKKVISCFTICVNCELR